MARPESESTQITLRVPDAWLERADALRGKLRAPGITVTRTDVLRIALARGLAAIENEP